MHSFGAVILSGFAFGQNRIEGWAGRIKGDCPAFVLHVICTALIYAKVTDRDIRKIKSPLDNL
jgi:hypothetical protein